MSGQSGSLGPGLLGSTYLAVQVSGRRISATWCDAVVQSRRDLLMEKDCLRGCSWRMGGIGSGAGCRALWPDAANCPVHNIDFIVHLALSGRFDLKRT